MVAVPVATPETTPAADMVAIDVPALLHTPPAAASFSAVVPPAYTFAVPVIGPGLGGAFTVTVAATVAVPQLLTII